MNKENSNWNGLTLEELRMRRAKSYVMSEVCKERLTGSVKTMQVRSKEHGIKGLFFKESILKGLKMTDYLFLGGKVAMLGLKLWKKRK